MCNSIESEPVTTRSCDIVTTKQESALIGSAPLCSQPAWCDSGDTDITMVTQSTGG